MSRPASKTVRNVQVNLNNCETSDPITLRKGRFSQCSASKIVRTYSRIASISEGCYTPLSAYIQGSAAQHRKSASRSFLSWSRSGQLPNPNRFQQRAHHL